MKIDLEYLKRITLLFIEAKTAHITLDDIVRTVINEDDVETVEQFQFHYQLMIENELVSLSSLKIGNLKEMGIIRKSKGKWGYVNVDLRLTQKGHDFANSLEHKEIYETLKAEFKDMPFKVIFESGRKLFEHVAKKKLDNILGS